MSMVVNHNLMAQNVANNLNSHYGRLATSTQRLSSGLRVNSAADDAAGLAIRELMRSDIAALNQGVRNANDAISLIQTADGALGVIDEKLIRMKELAEQAATGTYDSTQRLMIESEYQAMASEITRIANATDFNGTKLLDGTLAGDHDGSKMVSEGKIKIHFGTGNDSAEDYYYIEIGECTSEALGLGNNSTWQDVQRRGVEAFKQSLQQQIKNDKTLDDKQRGELLAGIDKAAEQLNEAINGATDYKTAYQLWSTIDDEGFMAEGKNWIGNSDLMDRYLAAAEKAAGDALEAPIVGTDVNAKVQGAIEDGFKTFENDITKILADPANDTDAKKIEAIKPLFDSAKTNILAEVKKLGLNNTELDKITTELNTAWTAFSGLTGAALNTPAWTKIGTDAKTAINTYLTTVQATSGATLQDEIALRNVGAQAYFKDPEAFNPADAPIVGTDVNTEVKGVIEDGFTTFKDKITKILADPANDTDAKKIEAIKPLFDSAKADILAEAKKLGLNEAELDKITAELNTAWTTFSGLTGNALDPAAWTKIGDDAYAAINTYLTTAQTSGAKLQDEIALRNVGAQSAQAAFEENIQTFWDGLRTTEKQKLQYAWGQAALYNLANADPSRKPGSYGIGASDFDFSSILGKKESPANSGNFVDITLDNEMLSKAFKDMQAKVGHMDFAGHTIETQEDAQMALTAINNAIVSKDKIRAHLGAAQNRLENTVSNLNIQAENLQAAESRISDVDVATEMTQFVRNQILTQSAVAMLSQANSLPQMAMQLIGG